MAKLGKHLVTASIVIVAIVALYFFASSSGVLKSVAPSPTSPSPGSPPPLGTVALLCAGGSNPTINLGVAVQNKLSTTTTLYSAATVSAYKNDGVFAGTATSSAGTTASYQNIALNCNANELVGNAYVLSGTSAPGTLVNSAKVPYDLRTTLGDKKIIQSSNTSSLQMTIRSTALANTSSGATVGSTNESAATTMGSGDTRSGYIDVQVNTANSQFGSDDGGLLWVIDTADSSVFSDKAISLSSSQIQLLEVPCPQTAVSFDSANRCYKSAAIKTSDGLVRVAWTMAADLGNPGTSADPFIYLEDVQYFEQNGAIVQDIYNSGGTTVGAARQQFGFDNS